MAAKRQQKLDALTLRLSRLAAYVGNISFVLDQAQVALLPKKYAEYYMIKVEWRDSDILVVGISDAFEGPACLDNVAPNLSRAEMLLEHYERAAIAKMVGELKEGQEEKLHEISKELVGLMGIGLNTVVDARLRYSDLLVTRNELDAEISSLREEIWDLQSELRNRD